MDGHVKQFNMDLLDYASLNSLRNFFMVRCGGHNAKFNSLGNRFDST